MKGVRDLHKKASTLYLVFIRKCRAERNILFIRTLRKSPYVWTLLTGICQKSEGIKDKRKKGREVAIRGVSKNPDSNPNRSTHCYSKTMTTTVTEN